ncbi:14606_t:CDS:2 [Funneliformis caledonium]|uniref:14606_t:CDS:1 n=1 Tax=Funneliformis caledonium TaxID=1117310 RepID=A0A9N9F0F0_9GLOM|nr:14606_t:CDS:2 [Funneliformis caledonium]
MYLFLIKENKQYMFMLSCLAGIEIHGLIIMILAVSGKGPGIGDYQVAIPTNLLFNGTPVPNDVPANFYIDLFTIINDDDDVEILDESGDNVETIDI